MNTIDHTVFRKAEQNDMMALNILLILEFFHYAREYNVTIQDNPGYCYIMGSVSYEDKSRLTGLKPGSTKSRDGISQRDVHIQGAQASDYIVLVKFLLVPDYVEFEKYLFFKFREHRKLTLRGEWHSFALPIFLYTMNIRMSEDDVDFTIAYNKDRYNHPLLEMLTRSYVQLAHMPIRCQCTLVSITNGAVIQCKLCQNYVHSLCNKVWIKNCYSKTNAEFELTCRKCLTGTFTEVDKFEAIWFNILYYCVFKKNATIHLEKLVESFGLDNTLANRYWARLVTNSNGRQLANLTDYSTVIAYPNKQIILNFFQNEFTIINHEIPNQNYYYSILNSQGLNLQTTQSNVSARLLNIRKYNFKL